MTKQQFFGLTVQRPALFALMAFALAALHGADANLSLFFLHRQDRWLLLVGVLLLALCVWRLPAGKPFTGSWRTALAIGTLMAIVAFAGHYLILSGHDLSRDEQMATFDAAIFAQGQFVAPLTGVWRDHAAALNTMFMYPTGQSAAWVSTYLPFNAALRSLFALFGDAALTGPAMTLLGAAALWGCVRRIWPDNREVPVVALLLYLGSGQIWFNAMTAYAMPAHLALNLCWLWLFLRRAPWADIAALMIAFVAVGLHQPILHPMFAAPILFLLVLERDWRRAALYFAGYAAIGAFWICWPGWMWSLVDAGAGAPQIAGIDFFSRIALAMEGSTGGLVLMVANLLRFAAWQHLLLLPLLIVGLRIVRRNRMAGALAGGILLTLAVVTVILPYQGHGFGYRYLHGLIGNCMLLAIYGWVSLGDQAGQWRTLLMRSTVAGLVILLPIQAWMAHSFYAPPAKVSKRLSVTDADYVVVGAGDAPFAADLVINPPSLGERPIRLLREAISPALARRLCAPQSRVALTGPDELAPILAYYDMVPPRPDDASSALADDLRRAGCRVVPIG
ncbi:hypothetical protein [Sphingopyxis sp.]|uniref:hypothetical protein n=1 Tax=Sphingopyxis sp. TaxID=1908224 RepID=UPI003F71AF48